MNIPLQSYALKNLLKYFLVAILLILLAQFPLLFSPSHPFVDDNNNGIDDFEEERGEYADPEIRAKLYGITFPIADLKNCSDYYSCRTFCEDPVNSQTCINYGKSHGFYKEEEINAKQDKILKEAKKKLSCDSYEACMSFCEVPANYDKCHSFAQDQGIVGGRVDNPDNTRVVEKAKEVLGCSSANECRSFCEQEENRQKCSDFAKESGLRGGEQSVGPGGCTSEQTCKTFCSNPTNFQICQGFSAVHDTQFTGPGGCNSEQSCRSYCEQNPESCGAFGGPNASPPPGYNAQEMCNRTPNCSWTGNTCQCGYYGETEQSRQKSEEFANFCRLNPDKCVSSEPGVFTNPEQRKEFEQYCSQNPDKCRSEENQGRGGSVIDPTAECRRYAGCAWIGRTCQCSAERIPQYQPPQYYSEQNQEASCKSGGCTWTGSYCDCSSSSQDSPALACGRTPGCSWINSTCQCSNSYPGEQPTYTPPPGGNPTQCQYPPGGCGANSYFDYGSCSCKSNSYNSPPGSTTPHCGQGYYWTGSNCAPSPDGSSSGGQTRYGYEDPATACTRGGGCTWTGSSCQCPSYSGSSGSSNSSGSNTQPRYDDPATACARGGCSWTGGSCQCPSSSGSGGYAPPQDSGQQQPSQPTYQPPQQQEPAPPPPTSESSGGSAPPPSDSGSSGSTNYAPPPSTESAPPPPSEPAPVPAPVQGIQTVKNFLLMVWSSIFRQ